MTAAITIALKDLRQRMRDRTAIIMGVIAPFALAAMFSLLIPSDQSFSTVYGVVDLDGGNVSALFTDQVLPGIVEAGFAEIVTIEDEITAGDQVESGDVGSVFIIPEGFSEAISDGRDATMTIIGNIDAALATQIAEAIATSFAEEVNAVSLSVAAVLGGFSTVQAQTLEDLSTRAALFQPSITVEQKEADSKQMSGNTFYAASMAIMFLFFTAQFGVLGLLTERRQGTLPRLAAAPIGAWAIVIGKALTGFVLGAIAMTVLVVASTLLLGADWGNPVGVTLLVVAAVISATGVSAMAATLAKTEEQASGWNAVLAMLLAILGGTFFSLDRAPEFVARLSFLTPHAWFLRGLDELASVSGTVVDVLPAVGVMTAMGVVTGAIGLMRAKQLVVGR